MAYEGVFYSFDSKAQFDALVAKVKAKCVKKDGCELWLGRMGNGLPRHETENGKTYNLRRLIFQAANEGFVIPKVPHDMTCTCGKRRCLSADHIKVDIRAKWNVKRIRETLMEGSVRVPAPPGFQKGCLLWVKAMSRDYGTISIDGQSRMAHAVALMIQDNIKCPPNGEDGRPLVARHKCKNKTCCEPSHLEWGTKLQNGQDRIRDGTNLAGDKSPSAKISSATASAIKMSWTPRGDPNYMSQPQRALKFGVEIWTINAIDNGYSWRHLPGPANKVYKDLPVKKKITREDIDENTMKMLVSRVEKKLQISPGLSKDARITSPCHIFTGNTLDGYGTIKYKNLNLRPHILVLEYKEKQQTPVGQIVRHLCGNGLCCSTEHLAFGTHTQNRIDAILHGDAVYKLSPDDVKEVRKISIDDPVAIKEAAEKYDTRARHIRDIINRKKWSFIE